MKYYADYWNECVYSVETNGDAVCKRQSMINGIITTFQFKRPNDEPWMWEENGVGDYIEPMLKSEFDSFGTKWVWSSKPNDAERISHSWRNFIKWI